MSAPDSPAALPVDHAAIMQLQARSASLMDAGRWEEWAELFIDDCVYKLQPRENHERGFPLATMLFESRGMLLDRAYALRETLFHDPYYQRHVLGPSLLLKMDEGRLHTETAYAVFRTKLSQETTVFNVGRYLDVIVPTADGLRFAQRLAVYDSEMIPNSIIYPI